MTVVPGDSSAAVRRLLPAHDGPGVERTVSTDHANLSIVVDDRYVVKWFSEPIADHDLGVLRTLADHGFDDMPMFVGSIASDEIDDFRVLAIVSEFLPDASDGWVWYVADVVAWLDGEAPLQPLLDTAATMGRITARMHLALAPPRPSTIVPLRNRIADRRGAALAHTTGDAAQRLQARLHQIDGAVSILDALDLVPMQRVHGDLHAGQFLRSEDRIVLTDFDGDPTTSTSDRLGVQPAERDLAGLVQSIDHVGRVAARHRPDADVQSFIGAGIDAAIQEYGSVRLFDPSLLWPLRVAQELHEYAYAAMHLPAWAYVPDAAMCALFPQEDLV